MIKYYLSIFFLSYKRHLACASDPLIIYIARKLKKQATADEWKRFNNHLNINKAVIMKVINDETTVTCIFFHKPNT